MGTARERSLRGLTPDTKNNVVIVDQGKAKHYAFVEQDIVVLQFHLFEEVLVVQT